ncbi:MAG: glycosyl hydrolase family 28-related protein [Rhodoferax sp.]|nr:glycosyl hydrolase family 28-related protein [Rhodoferax sp.]
MLRWPLVRAALTAAVVALCACAPLAPHASHDERPAAPAPDSSWYGTTSPHGPTWRNVTAFGAVGDGVHDDTAAIQAAVSFDRGTINAKRRAVVYLPPGTYLVSDTIVLWAFTHLLGCTTGTATLKLAANAPGFGNASALKPILAAASGYNTTSLQWWLETFHANDIFYSMISSVTIDASQPGNSGAVAVFWSVAQQTAIRDVAIILGGAAVGLDVGVSEGYATPPLLGIGGGGTVEDVRVDGGEFGIRVTASQYTFRGLRLTNQRVSSLYLTRMMWVFAFVDVVASGSPAFVTCGAGLDAYGSTLLVLDAQLQVGTPAIQLPASGIPLFLENVTFAGPPGALVAAGSDVWLNGGGTVPKWAGVGANTTNGGVWAAGADLGLQAKLPGARTSALPSRPRPWFNDGPTPCNALSVCGVIGDNSSDTTASLQACVDRPDCPVIFLPEGVYRLNDTITLTSSTSLIGESLSVLWLAPASPGFNDPYAPKPLLDTPDDPNAVVLVTDLSLQADVNNTGAALLRWRCGPASGAWDVHVNITNNVARGFWASGAGGGVVSNMWVWGADHSQWSMTGLSQDAADIGFLGESVGPLVAYGAAAEHHRLAMFSLQNATGYSLIVAQTEQTGWLPPDELYHTLHMDIGAGTSGSTVYGALMCSRLRGQLDAIVRVSAAGSGVSVNGLRCMGAIAPCDGCGVGNLTINDRWASLLADVNIVPSA